MKHFDSIIVGQGLAGTCMAIQLLEQQKSICVIDKFQTNTSSKVAAGIFHPMAFKKLKMSWKSDVLIPYAEKFYKESEDFLQSKFLYQKDFYRIFASNKEQNDWSIQSSNTLNALLENRQLSNTNISQEFGSGIVKNSFRLDSKCFLEAFKKHSADKQFFLEGEINTSDLEVSETKIVLRKLGISSNNIIFCEGQSVFNNQYFKWLPLSLTKGELLTVECKGLNLDAIVNKNFFVAPLGNNLYKVGATYEWYDLTDKPTEKAKQQIIKKFKGLVSLPFKVIRHEAGVRPTVSDRRPLIGVHPRYNNLVVFNGMGTKGTQLAPYFSKCLLEYLGGVKEALPKEVNINRFVKRGN